MDTIVIGIGGGTRGSACALVDADIELSPLTHDQKFVPTM